MTRLRPCIASAFAWTLPILLVAGLSATVSLSQREADRFQRKITQIKQHAESKKPTARRTAVSEAEVNSYLRYALAEELPNGVTDPYVTIEGAGRLSARAVVDLNQVKGERASGRWFDPLSYLGGKAPVTATGVLRTSSGMAQVDLESTTISGVPVPKLLLQTLVSFYSRSPENPNGISLDDPFKLPAGIKEIEVAKGEAVVIQ